jgi:protein gp37
MEYSKIAWTDHTFNPWIGCSPAGPGCQNCYAEMHAHRYAQKYGECWGPGATRYVTKSTWKNPVKWNSDAAKHGKRAKVFCASLADVFDKDGPAEARERLWDLIRRTPNLDWLILTKRPQNFKQYLPADWGQGYFNVWLGVTCENRKQGFKRVDILRKTPANMHFVSCEPLLEDVSTIDLTGIDWLIVGGESGNSPKALRPFDVAWARSLKETCAKSNVKFFAKQLGNAPEEDGVLYQIAQPELAKAANSHATNLECFPPDLRVQEWPVIASATTPGEDLGPMSCSTISKAERLSNAAKKAWDPWRMNSGQSSDQDHGHAPFLVSHSGPTETAKAPDARTLESFKATVVWLSDLKGQPIVGHMAQAALASIEGIIIAMGAMQEAEPGL